MAKIIHTFVVLAYKENENLQNCIDSVLNQKYESNVVIATSTPNKYIKKIAKNNNLKIFINPDSRGIGYDFDFASNCIKSDLITIAHQDDIYDFEYSYNVVKQFKKYQDSLILFTNYYEIKGEKKEKYNINLIIKSFLLFPMNFKILSKSIFFKRWIIRFGNAICCPAVTFVQKNVPKEKFSCSLKCNIDWFSWEKISTLPGRFIYIRKKCMGHRISMDSTTTEIINNGIRKKEDLIILRKFWPYKIAKFINRFYSFSEKNNKV